MKLNKIISVISLGITTAVVPISAFFSNNKKPTDNSTNRESNQPIATVAQSSEQLDGETKNTVDQSENLVNESSALSYDFESNDYFQGFITFKGNFVIFDKNNILELIKKQPQVINATKSDVIENYYLVSFFFKKDSDDRQKFDRFLKQYDLVGDFYEIENNKSPNKTTLPQAFNKNLHPWDLNYGGGVESNLNRYKRNFDSNNYTDFERNNAIQDIRYKINLQNEKRIGVAVLEAGQGSEYQERALIDANDKFYFDNNVTKIYNRWDIFWKGHIRWPTYGEHATRVASVISGTNGVNPYHNLYGVKANIVTLSFGQAESGLENEIAYIKKLDNVKIVNSSWIYGHPKTASGTLFNYNYYARYMDLLAVNDRDMIYVFAAGNNGEKTLNKLSGFQLSYNSIIVGSNDLSGSWSDFSSWGSNTYSSPLILANGEGYNFKGSGPIGSEGTSYAAPFISGVLANTLIQYKQKYKLGINSIIAKTILGVSSSKAKQDRSTEQLGLNEKNGVRILNYQKIKSAFDHLNYIKWAGRDRVLVNNIWKSKNNDKSLTVESLQLKKGDNLRISLSWLFKPTKTTVYNSNKDKVNLTDFIDYNNQDFDLQIRSKNGSFSRKSLSLNNFEFIQVPIQEDGEYEIIVSKYGKHQSSLDETELALSWTKERI
ncbi:serine protease [Mycoplasmoides gallisepticum S6]|uniref:Serine protease n=1 Tax=Mycoplasmoides gallisepticum S6 TaxID=1006581 RepID=A0A0F6CK06_MYCGL|nr:S8 family serine peptidase [Mycoplasmoides gallisepticum]AHB99428.1 serine protease [Mycoplasmoides gallisepticum S6]